LGIDATDYEIHVVSDGGQCARKPELSQGNAGYRKTRCNNAYLHVSNPPLPFNQGAILPVREPAAMEKKKVIDVLSVRMVEVAHGLMNCGIEVFQWH
jgi:hypothetical protein